MPKNLQVPIKNTPVLCVALNGHFLLDFGVQILRRWVVFEVPSDVLRVTKSTGAPTYLTTPPIEPNWAT